MKKILKIVVIAGVSWFLAHTLIIVVDGLTDERIKSDAGIILGTKVNPDGTLSERLEKRLDKGIELYQDSLISLIVVSGGLGKEGHYEGTKMSEYLMSKGIPAEKIIIDNEGITTDATANNVKNMNLNVSSVVVISQYFHISRTKLAFRKKGFTQVYGAHADYFESRDVYSVMREFVGYYKYLLFL